MVWTPIEWATLLVASVMPIGIAAIVYNRVKQEKGIGLRAIQAILLVLVVPMIFLLAIEGILNSEGTSALIGITIGYVLSGIGFDLNGGN